MIEDLDRTLERLLREKVPMTTAEYDISFETPTEAWATRVLGGTKMVANLYLYEVRENHELRDLVPRVEPRPDGSFVRYRGAHRIDLFYLVTTWSPARPPQVADEHRLLSALLRTLLRYPTLPDAYLQGSLVGQEPPLPTVVAQPDGGLPQPPAEFWSAIGNKLRPALNFVVTISVEPHAFLDDDVQLPPVASRTGTIGIGPTPVFRLAVVPALEGPLAAGDPVRRARVAATPAARLDAPVWGSPDELRVVSASTIRRGDTLMLDDGERTEFTRVRGTGEGIVEVDAPLRFEHAAAVALRRVTVPVAELGHISAPVAAGTRTLPTGAGEGLAAGEVLALDVPPRLELGVVESADAERIVLRAALAGDHSAGAIVRRAGVEALTTLSEPANRPATTITVTATNALAEGAVVAIGDEFARLGAITAAPERTVDVTPPLRARHETGAAILIVTPGELLGTLDRAAPSGERQVWLAGTAPAAGEVVALGPEPARYHRCTGVTAEGSGIQAPETTYAIGGLVTDAADPPTALAGAFVALAELDARVRTDGAGRFAFAGLPAGTFHLVVAATGYAEQQIEVRVPATSPGEYRVRMEPA